MDLSNFFSRWSSISPDGVYLSGHERKLSPNIIFSQAHCLATGLVALGLQSGEGVGVWINSSPELVVTFFAVQLAGGCYVPIFWYNDEKGLAGMLERSGCSVAIISLEYYDIYHRVEGRLASVRQLIVDSGDADAETTLPSNAKSLTPMLMVSKDVTIPEIQPGTRSLCYFPPGSREPAEKYRRKDTWNSVAGAAGKSFRQGEKVYNTLDLLDPEVLLPGAVSPLLAYASVLLPSGKDKDLKEWPGENVDTVIVDKDSAGKLAGRSDISFKRALWKGEDSEKEAKKLAEAHDAKAQSLKEAVDDAGFLS